MRRCALLGIGWLALMAFLAQQLPPLVPKVGAAAATLAFAVSDAPALVVAGCVHFGHSVGNVVTRPALYAQREFAAAGRAHAH